MIRVWEVHVFEYVRDVGNELVFIKQFKNYEKAKTWQIEWNSVNREDIVPTTYQMAAAPVEVVYPRDKFISNLQEYSEAFYMYLSDMRCDMGMNEVEKYLAEVSEEELLEWVDDED